VEDTPTTVKDIERIFNPKVAQLVEGLTKISLVQKDMYRCKPKTFVKCYLMTMCVILIKIADRLHNMQTMESKITSRLKLPETLYIYPLAHRLDYTILKHNWRI
jgi:GTP pyrophosphokinase